MPKIIKLTGIVGWEITAKGLENRLPKDGSDVLLKVDSVGGSVFEANRLYNAILDYVGHIDVELGAIAASAASYFPLAVGAENVKVRENTTFMAHKSWSFAIGNADDMKAEAEILDGFDKIIAKVYAKVTGKGVDETLEEMKDEIWLIGGQSVVDAGFASGIVEDDDSENKDDPEIVDKAEIVAMIAEARTRMKEADVKEDLEKWAAKLEIATNTVDVTKEGQSLLFGEITPSGDNTEAEMKLSEYLGKNPEAKAEFDEAINTAKAEGRAETNEEAVKADRERFAKVLALSGVAIPENVLKSASDGQTVADFAVAELDDRNAKIAAVKTEEKPDMGGVTATGQVPEGSNTPKASKAEEKMDAAVDKLVGKKNKEAK